MKVDIEVANKAIYWRGLFITRYSAVEFAIAELVSRAFSHLAYKHLGHPPFGPVKKFKRLNQINRVARADCQLSIRFAGQAG